MLIKSWENSQKKTANRGFHGIGTGLGQKDGKLNYMQVTFTVDQVLSIESARKLGVDCLNEFLNCINSREDFRKYIIEYPFTYKNAIISIIGQNPTGNEIDFIRSVHAGEGFLRYYSNSMAPPLFGLIHKETFEEAVSILNKQMTE